MGKGAVTQAFFSRILKPISCTGDFAAGGAVYLYIIAFLCIIDFFIFILIIRNQTSAASCKITGGG